MFCVYLKCHYCKIMRLKSNSAVQSLSGATQIGCSVNLLLFYAVYSALVILYALTFFPYLSCHRSLSWRQLRKRIDHNLPTWTVGRMFTVKPFMFTTFYSTMINPPVLFCVLNMHLFPWVMKLLLTERMRKKMFKRSLIRFFEFASRFVREI